MEEFEFASLLKSYIWNKAQNTTKYRFSCGHLRFTHYNHRFQICVHRDFYMFYYYWEQNTTGMMSITMFGGSSCRSAAPLLFVYIYTPSHPNIIHTYNVIWLITYFPSVIYPYNIHADFIKFNRLWFISSRLRLDPKLNKRVLYYMGNPWIFWCI